ncbi:MAG: diguanylate cyclase [Deltaproteobacteria bacterium]|nr:diguanylate cyclase [Deltaproteobacteria bacterium]
MPIRIRTRLLMGYIGGVAILLIVASIGLYSRHILLDGIKDVGRIAQEVGETQKLSLAIERLLMPVNDYLISGDIREKDNYNARLMEVMEILARVAGSPILMDKEKELLNALKDKIKIINAKAKEIFKLPSQSASPQRGASLMYSMDKAGEEAYAILNSYAEIDRKELNEILEKNNWAIMFVNYSMLGGGLAVVILGIFFVFYIERSVRLPIETLSKGIKELNGARWEKVEIRDGLEITTLADEYNKMVDRLYSAYETLEEKVIERTKKLHELNKRLEVLSVTDGLTGLYNHRYFYERLEKEMQRALRYKHPLSLIILDIDYFKNYNDIHGHLAGDVVLRGIADCIRTGARTVDVIARYGGEEFAVILPHIDKNGAIILAERIRNIIASQPFPHKETHPMGNLTISAGAAELSAHANNADSLVKLADDALYKAKELGRNRVEAAV